MKTLLEKEYDNLTDKAHVLSKAFKINLERRADIKRQLWIMETGIVQGDTIHLKSLVEAETEFDCILDVITIDVNGNMVLFVKLPPDKEYPDGRKLEVFEIGKFQITKL